jgi:hypothetical protein
MGTAADENWPVLLSLLPAEWAEMAAQSGAVERLRGFASIEAVLRTLLLHVGRGYSLRETAVQARLAGLAEVSDVTVLNRLRQAEAWWQELCQQLLREQGVAFPPQPGQRRVRVLDGSVVKEPGRTGSQWRVHYSLQLPSLLCDHLSVTAIRGKGTAEVLYRFPAAAGDLVLADRVYCTPVGIEKLRRQKADVMVRWRSSTLPLYTAEGDAFELLPVLGRLGEAGQPGEWAVTIRGPQQVIAGRICAIRKSEAATRKAQRKILRKAQQGGPETKPATLAYAAYVIVFTTVAETELSTAQVLNWYRSRWQIELVFKRMKSLAQLGHLPKHDDASSRAWLYGKLLVVLLTEKLIRMGRSISPWGYSLPEEGERQSMA